MDRIEKRIVALIDEHADEIISIGRDIFAHGELGFRERRTAQKVKEHFERYGIPYRDRLAVTGVKGTMPAHAASPTVAIIGEMDALPIPSHPQANPETGAAHCCGHNAQLAGMMGSLIALTDPEVRSALDGRVVFMAVPSEEYVDIAFKDELIRQGCIEFGGGKQELIAEGAFADVDIVLGHHTKVDKGVMLYNSSMNGFVNKQVRFFGRSVHASSEPEKGVDALNAMMLAMHALDLQRESFRDQDAVRIHGAILQGGEAPNVIADDVRAEYIIRAKTSSALADASKKFDRAMRAGAVGTGCAAEIKTIPGYLPVIPAKDPSVTEEAIRLAAGDRYDVEYEGSDVHLTASSDYGDVSSILPVLQFYTGGFTGALHSPLVRLTDEYLAYVVTAKVFALETYRLLRDNASRARVLIENFSPAMSTAQYLKTLRAIRRVEKVQGEEITI